MPLPWPEIVAAFREKLNAGLGDAAFNDALGGVADVAAEVHRTWLGQALFGWTSMHDLCVQQTDHEPYSRPYLRISPLRSGAVDFRYVDTPILARQWHRVVPAQDSVQRFQRFLESVRWIETVN